MSPSCASPHSVAPARRAEPARAYVRPITGRSAVVTGTGALADGLLDGLDELGVAVLPLECDFGSEAEVVDALADRTAACAASTSSSTPGWRRADRRAAFMDVDDEAWISRCEGSLAGAWWLSQQAIAPLVAGGGGSVVYLVPSVGLTGAAGFSMLATVAEGIRVLAKGCGRQWGKHRVTANIVVTEPGLWVGSAISDELFRAISLSVPAFPDIADPHDDLGPLVSMLGDSASHYLTAGTLVADGGVWNAL